MIGRILTDLKRRGVLVEAPRNAARVRPRRKLRHRPWATRKPRFWRVREPGDLVALDTKQVRPARGVVLQHFSARDLVSRWDVLQAHTHRSHHKVKRRSERRGGSLYPPVPTNNPVRTAKSCCDTEALRD
jgi:hypothetical protein